MTDFIKKATFNSFLQAKSIIAPYFEYLALEL